MTAASCPNCGRPIDLWTAKFAWFSRGKTHCPGCHRGLVYEMKPRDSLWSLLSFLAIWVGANAISSLATSRRVTRLWIELGCFVLAFFLVSLGAAAFLRSRRPLRVSSSPPGDKPNA